MIDYEVIDGIAYIRLNRPEKLNAFTNSGLAEYVAALDRLDRDDDALIAVVSGAGRAFSSGSDISQRLLAIADEGVDSRSLPSETQAVLRCSNWKPLVAAVHGYAIGHALGTAMLCELVVAAEDTRFQVTETTLGVPTASFWAHIACGGVAGDGQVPAGRAGRAAPACHHRGRELQVEHDRRIQGRDPGQGEQVAGAPPDAAPASAGSASAVGDRAALAGRLAAFARVAIARPGLRAASVAVCVLLQDDVPGLLITRRAADLRRHAGQWALPGGSREAGESVPDAALRELREETGVVVPADAVLGVLDDFATRSGFLITPVVVWGGPLGALSRQASEVARMYVIPLADFDRPPELLRIPESPAPVLRLALLGGYVYAPTAAIIHQFCQLALHGLTTRVAHYEQPVFAWR